MTTATQTRGHCQLCGRQQAVRGGMSAHGYTVANGWFQGVCQGHHHKPLETDRSITDQMVIDVTAQAKHCAPRPMRHCSACTTQWSTTQAVVHSRR